MPAEFDLPEDFKPGFSKRYTHNNTTTHFKVVMQYFGIKQEGDMTPMHKWVFAIQAYNGKLIDAGVFWWDPSERKLTNENVANHLADWYRHQDFDAMLEHREEVRKMSNQYDPQIQAVAVVKTMFYPHVDVDFETIWFTKNGEDFRCILATNLDDRYYEFIYNGAAGNARVDAYTHVDEYIVTDGDIKAALSD